MDPIYYIYHKLYHIFGDHVGHCHQARPCARSGAGRRGETSATCPPLQMHFFCHLLQIKTSQSQPAKVRRQHRRYDGPINLPPLLFTRTAH